MPNLLSDLYAEHLERLQPWLADALERAGRKGASYSSVLFHAGRLATYFADDQEIPFRSAAHFRRWVPIDGPDHLVLAHPGRRPLVLRVRPVDYWYDTSPPATSFWESHVELVEVADLEAAAKALPNLGDIAYVGESAEVAAQLGFAADQIQPPALLPPLDWYRGFKTPFEIQATEEACARSAAGHLAARDAFLAGASEREVHWAYVAACGHLDNELPFAPITALDQKASILHYQHKRGAEAAPGQVLLCDAGATVLGWASDLTRTWVQDGVDPVFERLVLGVDALERRLVEAIAPGVPYPDLHLAAHRGVAELLCEVGIFEVSVEEALDRGLTGPFLPHGLGHHLGLQVHDVGGRQLDPEGTIAPPPEDHPHLRTTRELAAGHLVTIEPGIYFIDLLLNPLRQGPDGGSLDWELIDRLAPLGGIRIEDDVLCTEHGYRDLSRAHLPGPAGEK